MAKPRVLLVYNTAPLPENRIKTLSSWRKLAAHVDVEFAFTADYRRSLRDRLLYRAKLAPDPCGLNRRVLELQRTNRYDVILMVKGVNVWPGTVRALRAAGAKVVFWSNDDMWGWHNRSLWFTWAAKEYDLVVTQKSYNCNPAELPSLGARVLFQDKAYDPAMHFRASAEECARYVHDVTFIGTYERERLDNLTFLARAGISVHVYGWSRTMPAGHQENLHFHNTHLYGRDYPAAIGGARINLNFLRRMSRDRQTSRSIEIPACGGFMLAERTDEHERLFRDGVEAVFFADRDELLGKIRHYLENDDERRRIAEAGYSRCLHDGCSFDERMAEILAHVLPKKAGERA